MDCVVHGLTESRTRLSNFHFHFHPAREDFSLGDTHIESSLLPEESGDHHGMMQVLSGVWGGHMQSLQAGKSQGGGGGEESGACLGGMWGLREDRE